MAKRVLSKKSSRETAVEAIWVLSPDDDSVPHLAERSIAIGNLPNASKSDL